MTDSWQPACMEPDELVWWRAGEISACRDCEPTFAARQSAGRCNGIAGLGLSEPEDEEPAVTPARKERAMATISAHVEAPCELCIHREVCSRREAIAALEKVGIAHDPMPAGVTLSAWAKVECDAFLPEAKARKAREPKGTVVTVGGPNWTPERRAAQSARMRRRMATIAAERAEASA